MTRKSTPKRKSAPRTCRACGMVFTPYRSNQRSCSPHCRLSFWRVRNRSIRITTEKIEGHEVRLSAVETAVRSLVDLNLARRIADLEARVGRGEGMEP